MCMPATMHVVAASAGFYVLIYHPENERVARLPIVAWRVDEFGVARPAVAGNDEFNAYDAILTPDGLVIDADCLSAPYAAWLDGQRRQPPPPTADKVSGVAKAA